LQGRRITAAESFYRTQIEHKTGVEIYREGYRILAKELGVTNFIRFIQTFEKEKGDYTEDRHKWQDEYSVERITKEIKNNNI